MSILQIIFLMVVVSLMLYTIYRLLDSVFYWRQIFVKVGDIYVDKNPKSIAPWDLKSTGLKFFFVTDKHKLNARIIKFTISHGSLDTSNTWSHWRTFEDETVKGDTIHRKPKTSLKYVKSLVSEEDYAKILDAIGVKKEEIIIEVVKD